MIDVCEIYIVRDLNVYLVTNTSMIVKTFKKTHISEMQAMYRYEVAW